MAAMADTMFRMVLHFVIYDHYASSFLSAGFDHIHNNARNQQEAAQYKTPLYYGHPKECIHCRRC